MWWLRGRFKTQLYHGRTLLVLGPVDLVLPLSEPARARDEGVLPRSPRLEEELAYPRLVSTGTYRFQTTRSQRINQA
eukprot:7062945-Pyramimonas_sp.AAC.1